MNETPKKLSHREECCFLCKKVLANEHDKIRVFGKSTIGIPTLILRATKVDLSLYVGCEKIAICRMSCYKRLTRYKNALRKVDEIEHEIALEFNMLVPVSVKRMGKEVAESTLPKSKRSLAFEDSHIESNATASIREVPVPTDITVLMPNPTIPLTSTPINKAKTPHSLPDFEQTETESVPVEKKTKVSLTVQYPSKTIRKELIDDFAILGKAIAHGSPQRIARAVLKNSTVKKYILEKVLKLLTLQVSGLCSRRKPSLLRSKTKNELSSFEFKNLCLEWKERAPLFYAFLMTIAFAKMKNNLQWLPCIAVAGSILLKQRNSHMNGCATIIGILIKSRSIEVIKVSVFYIIFTVVKWLA